MNDPQTLFNIPVALAGFFGVWVLPSLRASVDKDHC